MGVPLSLHFHMLLASFFSTLRDKEHTSVPVGAQSSTLTLCVRPVTLASLQHVKMDSRGCKDTQRDVSACRSLRGMVRLPLVSLSKGWGSDWEVLCYVVGARQRLGHRAQNQFLYKSMPLLYFFSFFP